MKLLESYDWPGNIRELQSVIKYAVVHAVGDVITPACLPEHCRGPSSLAGVQDADAELAGLARLVRRMLHTEEPELYRRLLTHIDRVTLQEALHYVDGNQVQASQRLGMSRSTLRSKLSHLDSGAAD